MRQPRFLYCASERDKKTVLFTGRLDDGVIQGDGKSYDYDGNLVYEGGFADDQYDGDGRLYQNGRLLYDGAFAKNAYEGSGVFMQTSCHFF